MASTQSISPSRFPPHDDRVAALPLGACVEIDLVVKA